MCGLYVLYFYVEPYAIATGITDASFAFYLLAILNAASILGRIVPNYLADKVGALNMMIPCNFATGVLTLCLIPTHTVAPLTVIVAFYGFFSGSFVSLPPGIYVELTPNRAMLGTRMGMGFLIGKFSDDVSCVGRRVADGPTLQRPRDCSLELPSLER